MNDGVHGTSDESGVNVLLVDDHHENLVALEAILKDLTANLVFAYSGQEALKYLLEMPFSLILLDVQMPDMDGFETARLIHERDKTRHIPIIFLTAIHTDEVHRDQGYRSGAVDYLFKPFDPCMLRIKVASFIEIGRKRTVLEQEILRRQEVELELLKLKAQLERRVDERTRELREVNRQLEQGSRAKDEFLAMLAHELRNPLSPIVNIVELWRRGGCNDGQQQGKALEVIERELYQLTRLIDDLLDVARITTGKMHLHKQPLPLNQAIDQALEVSRHLMEVHGHRVEVALPEQPVWVNADPTRLTQILANLLINAAKYTDDGGTIVLGVTRMAPPATYPAEGSGTSVGFPQAARETSSVGSPCHVLIRVRDNGIGIPCNMLEGIFEPLLQLNASLHRAHGGLGIGLALVKHLVELHGGTVSATSAGEGQGSEFLVSLPEATPPENEAAEEPEQLASESIPQMSGRGEMLKVLIVDDNIDAADTLGALLRLSGHDVQTVHRGLLAIDEAQSYQPDVLVCDLGLPDIDGYEVVRRLRALRSMERMTVIALTGYSQSHFLQEAVASGFDHYLVKPVDVDRLLDILQRGRKDVVH